MKNLILETKILTELNRMKEIMGLSLITEGVGDELLKLLGFDSKTIDNLSKSGFDINDLSKLSDEFTNLGIRDVAGFKRAVSYLDDAGRFTNEALTQFVKQNPTLMDEIANIVTKQSADYAKSIVTNANISTLLGSTRSTNINDVLSAEAFQGVEDNIIERIDLQLTSIDALIKNIEEGKVPGITKVPDELSEVRDSLLGKKADVKNLKNKRSTSTGVNDVNQPSRLGNSFNSNTDPELLIRGYEVDDIFKKLKRDQQNYLKEYIRAEMKGGKTYKQLSTEVDTRVDKYLKNMLQKKEITQKQYDDLIKKGSKLWPGWKFVLIALSVLAPASVIAYIKWYSNEVKTAVTSDDNSSEDSSGEEYDDNIQGFKKFVNDDYDSPGYTPDIIDGEYVLKPNGYDNNKEYYKKYLVKFEYNGSTFEPKK
jgi:hypothetical protein